MTEGMIAIEVAFATPEKQEVISLEVPPGTMIHDAIHLSRIGSHFPDYDLSVLPVGVWSEVKPKTYVVQAGDRVELFRSLMTNAKDARRKRAQTQLNKKS